MGWRGGAFPQSQNGKQMRSTVSSLATDRAAHACFNFSFSRNIMKWEGGGGVWGARGNSG